MMSDMFSPKRNTALKRTADEAAASSSTAAVNAPASEVKKQTAAQSLANLFTSESESFEIEGGGGDNNILSELMGDASEGGTTMPAMDEEGKNEDATNNAAAAAAGFDSPRKKIKLKEEEEELAVALLADAMPADTDADVSKTATQSTTPCRVAGANVLASLGGSGSGGGSSGGQQNFMDDLPALPPMVVEVATSGGLAQHDYLLQNLVHVREIFHSLFC
jgi:hypothetical protein